MIDAGLTAKIEEMRRTLPDEVARDIMSVDPAWKLLGTVLSMIEPMALRAKREGELARKATMPRYLNPYDRRSCTPYLAQAWYEGWDSAVDNA